MFKVKIILDMETVLKKARAASLRNLGLFGGLVRKAAQRSIKTSPVASNPGTPPNTRKGLLRKAIIYAVEPETQNVVIGPTSNVVGDAGHPHEFGGKYRKQEYPARPFMGPALVRATTQMDKIWANSVK